MDKKLAMSFYEAAELSFTSAETLAKAKIYNTPTIMLIQHAAECYVKAMIETATKKTNIYDLYREINSKDIYAKSGKIIKSEGISKPLIPHRFKFLLQVLKEQDGLFKNRYTTLAKEYYNFDRAVETIFQTYTYFRFPQDPNHTTCAVRTESDIVNAWSTLQDLRDITKEFLIEYGYIQNIDIRDEMDIEDLTDYDD